MTAAELLRALERMPPEAEVELRPDPPGAIELRHEEGDRLLLVAVSEGEPAVLMTFPLGGPFEVATASPFGGFER